MSAGSLDVAVRATIAGREVAITASSSAGRRLVTVEPIQPLTLEEVLRALASLLSLDLPDLGSGPWSGLTEGKLDLSAFIASDGGAFSASLDISYQQPVAIPGGALGEICGVLATVRGFTISYDAKAGVEIKARVETPTFSTAAATAGSKLQLVGYPFPAPATAAPPVFRLNYFGVGQRVGPDVAAPGSATSGEALADPLASLFQILESELSTSDPPDILGRLATRFYRPDRDWFVAVDVALRGFRVRALFNDPSVYGLEITVAQSPPSFFSGLLFEILFQKLGPGLGVYYGALTLPDAMRRIEIDGVILVLPGFSLWVYTNGDFRVNVGWPLGPNAIGVIVGPMSGQAGFYFAKLRSADDPSSLNANAPAPVAYNPILQFGMAMEVSVEVDCSAGPLSASLSLSYNAMLQGVIAWAAAPTSDPAAAASITGPPNHYWFAGAASEVLLIQGSIDFVIIKASVTVRLAAELEVAYETGCATIIAVSAEVSVDVAVHMTLFTIHLSFDMTISHTFTLGSGPPARIDRPNAPGLAFSALAPPDATGAGAPSPASVARTVTDGSTTQASSLRIPAGPAAPPARVEAVSARLTAALTGSPPAETLATFVLLPTALFAAGEGPGRLAAVAALVLDCPQPGSPGSAALTAFEGVAVAMFGWLLRGVVAPNGEPAMLALLDAASPAPKQANAPATAASALAAAGAALGHGSAPPSAPFGGRDGFLDALSSGLPQSLSLRLIGATPPAGDDQPPPGALLPLPETLALSVAGGPFVDLASPKASPDYADAISRRYAGLGLGPAASPNGATPLETHSFAHLILGDYMLLLLRQLASSLDLSAPAATLASALAAVDFGKLAAFASRFLISGLRLPDPADAAGATAPDSRLRGLYQITGQQFEGQPLATSPEAAMTASLRPASGASWIAPEAGVVATVTMRPPAKPAYVWSCGAPRAMAPGEVLVRQTSALSQATLTVALNQQTALRRGGSAEALLPLPAALLDRAQSDAGLTLQFQADGAAAAIDATAALLIPLEIRRLPAPAGVGKSLWQAGVYALVAGIDDATRERLHGLLIACGQLGATTRTLDPASLRIDLLTSVAGAGAFTAVAGSASPASPAFSLGLARTRPSVAFGSRDPVTGLRSDVGLDDRDSADAIAAPADFLRLVWEASVDNAAAMVLCDATALGGGEADVFASSVRATVDLLVTVVPATGSAAAGIEVPGWADRLLAAAAPAGAPKFQAWTKPDPPQAAAPYGVTLPASAAGTIGFEVDLAIARPPVAGEPDVVGLYHLVQYACGSDAGDPSWSLPIGPGGGANPAVGVWLCQCRQTVSVAAPGAPYASINQPVPMHFRLVDIFGNPMPDAFAPPLSTFTPLYADRLITPAQWPGIRLAYAFGPGAAGRSAVLSLTTTFDSGAAGPSGASTRQAAVDRYTAILAQLDDPRTSAALLTDLDDGRPRETDPPLKTALRDFAALARFWLTQNVDAAFALGSAVLDASRLAAPAGPGAPAAATAKTLRLSVTGYGDGALAPAARLAAALAEAIGLADPFAAALASAKASADATALARAIGLGDGLTKAVAAAGALSDAATLATATGLGARLAAALGAAGTAADGAALSQAIDLAGRLAAALAAALSAAQAKAAADALDLGGRRAKAAADWLAGQGFAAANIEAAGSSSAAPPMAVTVAMTGVVSRPVLFDDLIGNGASGLADVMALSVTVALSRPPALLDPEASLVAEIGEAACPVYPHADAAPGTADSGDSKRGLGAFARAFEAAFSALDGAPGGTRLRLAQRSGVIDAASDDNPDLWAIRMGPKGFHFQAAEAVAYALRPLAPQALSGALADGALHNAVDLDASAAACLRAIDQALTPGRAVALARLDATAPANPAGGLHARLLSVKRSLAESIPLGLAKVLPSDPDGDLDAARDALEGALLTSLASFATITAAVQLRATVETSGRVGDARDEATPPVFIGDVGAALNGASLQAGHFFFSSASLPVAGAGSHALTSLLSLSEPGDGAELIVDLDWGPGLLQHEFEADKTFSGYMPSAYLRFALPDAAPALRYPKVTIPLPLQSDPEPPKLGAHRASGASAGAASVEAPDAQGLAAALDPMLQWTYDVTLSAELAAQDELWFSPSFNAPPALDASDSVPPELRALFEAAVGMEAALPLYATAFAALDQPGRPPAELAAQLEPFVVFAEALAAAWRPKPAAGEALAIPADAIRLTLEEMKDETYRLVLARPAASAPSAPWPALALGGTALRPDGTPAPIEGGSFVGFGYPFKAKPDLGALRLTWSALALGDCVTADFNAFVRRNAKFGKEAADPAFVLRTPKLAFPTSAVPLLTLKTEIVIRPTWPLADMLAALMGRLAQIGAETADPALSLECVYRYQLLPRLYPGAGAAGLLTQTPILMATDLALPRGGGGAEASRLAGEIADWVEKVGPTRRGASLGLAMTLFGAPPFPGAERLALAQIERITIPIEAAPANFWPAP